MHGTQKWYYIQSSKNLIKCIRLTLFFIWYNNKMRRKKDVLRKIYDSVLLFMGKRCVCVCVYEWLNHRKKCYYYFFAIFLFLFFRHVVLHSYKCKKKNEEEVGDLYKKIDTLGRLLLWKRNYSSIKLKKMFLVVFLLLLFSHSFLCILGIWLSFFFLFYIVFILFCVCYISLFYDQDKCDWKEGVRICNFLLRIME